MELWVELGRSGVSALQAAGDIAGRVGWRDRDRMWPLAPAVRADFPGRKCEYWWKRHSSSNNSSQRLLPLRQVDLFSLLRKGAFGARVAVLHRSFWFSRVPYHCPSHRWYLWAAMWITECLQGDCWWVAGGDGKEKRKLASQRDVHPSQAFHPPLSRGWELALCGHESC